MASGRLTFFWSVAGRVVACLGALSCLSLAACSVNVPDREARPFACKSGGDCADAYECKLGACVQKSSLGCDGRGCPQGQSCAKLADGSSLCKHSCAGGSDCRLGEVCVDGASASSGTGTNPADPSATVKVCLNCPLGCGGDLVCVLSGQASSTMLDTIQQKLTCMTPTRCTGDPECSATGYCSDGACVADCRSQGCGKDQVCISHGTNHGECVASCLTTSAVTPCGGTGACVAVSGWPTLATANSPVVIGTVQACKPCAGTCGAPKECTSVSAAQQSQYDSVTTQCDFVDHTCTSDADCSRIGAGICVKRSSGTGVCRLECSACSADTLAQACATVVTVGGPQKSVCVRCGAQCADAGSLCAAGLGSADPLQPIIDKLAIGCGCDSRLCTTALGATAYCAASKCTTDDCRIQTDPATFCAKGSVCDDVDGRCRADCLQNGGDCASPAACVLRPTVATPSGLAELCVENICSACGSGICLPQPISGAPLCLVSPSCGANRDCTGLDCLWVGHSDGDGSCGKACGGCMPATEICAAAPDAAGITHQSCVPKPNCSPACSSTPPAAICSYAEGLLAETQCAMGCQSASSCMGAEACVVDATRPGLPYGVCRSTDTSVPTCASVGGVVMTAQRFDNQTATVQVCDRRMPCNAGTTCPQGQLCTRAPGAGAPVYTCLPWCETSFGPLCYSGEECATVFALNAAMMTLAQACVPTGAARYQPGDVSYLTTGTMTGNGLFGDTTAHSSSLQALRYSEVIPAGAAATSVVLTGDDTGGSIFAMGTTANLAFFGRAHLGAGEMVIGDPMAVPPTTTGRRNRAVFECDGVTTSTACTSSPAPHLYGRGVTCTGTSCVFDDTVSFTVGGKAGVGYTHAALRDGYLAVLVTYTASGKTRSAIRVARLVNNPTLGYLYWAPGEIFLAPDDVVREVAVSRDVVAYLTRSLASPTNQALSFVRVRELFAPPASIPVARRDWTFTAGAYGARDLTVDEHWLAWVTQVDAAGTLNASSLGYLAADMANAAPVAASPTLIGLTNGSGLANATKRVRPSLHRHYLAWNEGQNLKTRELTGPTTSDRSYAAGLDIGLPLLVTQGGMLSLSFWEDFATYGRFYRVNETLP